MGSSDTLHMLGNVSDASWPSVKKYDYKPKYKNLIEKLFDNLDNKSNILMNENEIMKKIFETPISQSEYIEALEIANSTHGESPWFCESEAQDIVYDLRRRSYGLKPIMSTTFSDPIIIGNFIDSEKYLVEEIMLPEKIALICEWQTEKSEWKLEVVNVMRTVSDFWNTYKILSKSSGESESYFSLPLKGNEEKSKNIFNSLIESGKRLNDDEDSVNIDIKNQKNVRAIVTEYNSLFPVWSFVKIPKDSIKDNKKIEVPFIRINGQAINEININLKDTKTNIKHGIRIMGTDFSQGYIPKLILSFIGGNLPNDISAIVFSKTIAINGNIYFKGYRLRILTKNTDYQSLTKCKEYLQTQFISENINECNYSKCVVRINIPKNKNNS